MDSGSTQTPASPQAGGFPCPRCKYLLRFPIEALLTQPALICPQCGLELEIDFEHSAAALQELRKYSDGLDDARRIFDEGKPGG